MRKRVVLESPFAGQTHEALNENILYAIEAMNDSFDRGEAPFASHLLYPAVLDDNKQLDRALGIECGYIWLRAAELQVFYTDRGWSAGMTMALRVGMNLGIPQEFRALNHAPELPPTEEQH